MLIKIIIVFLGFMALVAMVGRALFPSAMPRVLRKDRRPTVCRACGRHLIGKKPCDCGGRGGAK